MASEASSDDVPHSELKEIIKLMWGANVKDDVFKRWAQGGLQNIILTHIFYVR